jgi:two-component system sensor histidine kinase/response regulator
MASIVTEGRDQVAPALSPLHLWDWGQVDRSEELQPDVPPGDPAVEARWPKRTLERSASPALLRYEISEFRRRVTSLEKRNAELEAFAHMVAHELKSSLHLVTGFAELLQQAYDDLSEEQRKRCAMDIAQNGFQLAGVVDELLLLAEVEQREVPTEPIDTADIIEAATTRLAHLIAQYDAEIRLPTKWPIVLGYAPWVEEVWINYLSNAVKYGGQPPRVVLGAEVGGTVRFWVRDNGDGLSPQEQKRLFTPFSRLARHHAKGHGLGLSIVKRIVDKLGGEVSVESSIGEGSVFSFTLPAAR